MRRPAYAESPTYARRPSAAVRTLCLVGTNSGDSPPHEMSYLTVTKLLYTVTPAQESAFTGCAAILCFPQQCPFWRPEAASVWQSGHVDRHRRRTYNSSKVPPGEAAHFISDVANEKTCHEHRSSSSGFRAGRSCVRSRGGRV